MRVAFVSMRTAHHDPDPPRERARRVAGHLADRGHDVTYHCAQWWEGGRQVPRFDHEGIQYRAVVRSPAPRKFAAKLPVSLRRADPDVVHTLNSPPRLGVAAAYAARLAGCPAVVDWWCDRPGEDESEYGRLVRRADAVCAPSRAVKTSVREHGAGNGDVHVVPESVDMELIRDAPVDERYDLVYGRHLDEYANVENFLLALAELRGRSWTAAVVGDGPTRADADATARDLRIDDRVEFLGDLSREERVPIYKGAHAFAQTAFREPFATELLWALACGCLGVVEYQADSAAHELVENRDRGRRVTSPQELADAMVAAADRDRVRVNDAFAEFDHDAILERYLSVYRTVLDERGWF